ncbi:hypothetical protein DFR28_101229 [Arenicella xantha]|uniref:Uncharacterized protein n=1 Tax=Arenicella xantha TaxID=644221 RepID=A0A395JQK8_9GAMM|nr:hypothetical protein DFR28_101229 [Arenicella xantha]
MIVKNKTPITKLFRYHQDDLRGIFITALVKLLSQYV